MNKYLSPPEQIIDLHRQTTAEAETIIADILKGSKQLHIRIIVGKGNHSAGGAILPNFVKKYLSTRGIKFAQSKIQDGGEGALEVFLK